MQQQVFPVLGDEKELPLYVIGIGVEYRQFPINRPSGYEFPQFLITRRGAGKIVINGTEHELTKDSVCFIPAGCPTAIRRCLSRGCSTGCPSADMNRLPCLKSGD